jgi:hypothetical protein
MELELAIALIIAIPIILFPAAYVWYLNIGGIYATLKVSQARRAAREEKTRVTIKAKRT